SKRNFVSRFARNYEYDFREYDAKRDRENIIALYQKWNTTTCHETLAFEDKLIKKALDNGQALGLVIMVLYVGDALAAFSVHSKTNDLIGHTFFEKADIQFEGAYQFINQKCAEIVFDGVKYVNRQDDIGIEGLRKAKLSYHPVILLDKYRVKRKCK
ncbi:MAG: phosphatidylglycerol lysyltransferase domain-containing protein, partial [Firmicutes bacterium]|nr:phosphatidylglycerol lysyltransferase domain-containing protein [Bacillota bacterium]